MEAVAIGQHLGKEIFEPVISIEHPQLFILGQLFKDVVGGGDEGGRAFGESVELFLKDRHDKDDGLIVARLYEWS